MKLEILNIIYFQAILATALASFDWSQLSSNVTDQTFDNLANNSVNPGSNSRIYNGVITGRYPFMVAIMHITRPGRGELHCGGTLLNDRWVLTAAHCVAPYADQINRKEFEAWVGAYDISQPENSNFRQTRVIERGIWRNEWNDNTKTNDIAVLELSSSVTLNSNFETVCVGTANYDNIGGVRLIGWGKWDCKKSADRLNSADSAADWRTPFWGEIPCSRMGDTEYDNSICRDLYGRGNDPVHITSSMLCARLRNNGNYAEQAPGDSGGPLFYANRQGKLVQVGLVSFNRSYKNNGCPVADYPGVYTRTASFIQWLRNEVGNFDTCV